MYSWAMLFRFGVVDRLDMKTTASSYISICWRWIAKLLSNFRIVRV